jgi:hypothetical protein
MRANYSVWELGYRFSQRGLRPDKGLFLGGHKMKGVVLREITA